MLQQGEPGRRAKGNKQDTKNKYCVIPLYDVYRIGKLIGTGSITEVLRGVEEGGMRSYSLMGTEFLLYGMIKSSGDVK